ncbi:MAG: DNA-deoxyinosine glycosylase [Betaproteobacteria bacterium RIFCSPLOWO2_12_FULL_66_14]|nr:MAG: DNA-deoxyinosine glycosylase [Betaproteobacteria bacterium RIFCSPLOWO2_12_FULL_66_14]
MGKARVRSFAPIAERNARVLILGSMPGRASLEAGQYYAHRHNAFWRIAADLLQFDRGAPYRTRAKALRSARIAVLDVLRSCVRPGSMDAMIDRDSEVANDFRKFFRTHRGITHVFFNGAKAEASFRRHVLPEIDATLRYQRLPSTSPANASVPFASKRRAWRAILTAGRRHRRSRR